MQTTQLTLNFDVQINVNTNTQVCGQNQKRPEEKENITTITPLMKQWNDIKAQYPTALLLFRVGDFYEAYQQDAVDASKILDITLTKRPKTTIQMCGFPYHVLDRYLPLLVRAGRRVAICDSVEDVKAKTKKLVKRPITEIADKINN